MNTTEEQQPNNNNKELELLWTVNQTAKYLSVSPFTVYRWIKEGKVIEQNKVVRFSKQVRIPRSEVTRIAGIIKSKLEN